MLGFSHSLKSSTATEDAAREMIGTAIREISNNLEPSLVALLDQRSWIGIVPEPLFLKSGIGCVPLENISAVTEFSVRSKKYISDHKKVH